MRNLIYIDDVVSAVHSLISSPENFKETYLLVNDEHHSVKDIAESIIKECNSGKLIQIDWPSDSKRIEVGDQIFSNQKIKDKLNWSPAFTFKEGLKNTIEFYKSNRWYYQT